MKIHRTADDFLQDIVDWGERALRHAASVKREQFMSDEKSQDAISKCIANVGEAANKALKLDPTIKQRFPGFAAEKAYAARNVISHDYFAVRPERRVSPVEEGSTQGIVDCPGS